MIVFFLSTDFVFSLNSFFWSASSHLSWMRRTPFLNSVKIFQTFLSFLFVPFFMFDVRFFSWRFLFVLHILLLHWLTPLNHVRNDACTHITHIWYRLVAQAAFRCWFFFLFSYFFSSSIHSLGQSNQYVYSIRRFSVQAIS